MGNLGDILQKKIKQMGATRQVEAAGVIERVQEELEKHIPKEDFEVISFNRGMLKIKAKNSVVASEIQRNTQNIKNNLGKIDSIKIAS